MLFTENVHMLYVFNLLRNFGLRLFMERQQGERFQSRISFLFFGPMDMEDIDKRAQVVSYCSV